MSKDSLSPREARSDKIPQTTSLIELLIAILRSKKPISRPFREQCADELQMMANVLAEIGPKAVAHDELVEALEALVHDCMASDFNEHWDSFKAARAILAKAKAP